MQLITSSTNTLRMHFLFSNGLMMRENLMGKKYFKGTCFLLHLLLFIVFSFRNVDADGAVGCGGTAMAGCVPSPSYAMTLIPSVMVFGGGVFGRQLGLDEVMKVEPLNGIGALTRDLRFFSYSRSLSGRSHGHRHRKRALTKNLFWLCPWCWTFSF